MPLESASQRSAVSNRETLSSNKLRWFSLLTYICLTLAVFDRDPERSGGASIYGAVAQHAVINFALAGLTIMQSSGYLCVSSNKLLTLFGERSDVGHGSEVSHQARPRRDSFIDVLSHHKRMSMLYWGGASLSCFFAIFNSVYLMVLPSLQADERYWDAVNSSNHTGSSGFNVSGVNPNSYSLENYSWIEDVAVHHIPTRDDSSMLDVLSAGNEIVVLLSVWLWNFSNLIEVGYFAYYCLCKDMNNAFVSTAQAVSNVARTMVVAKQYEAVSYPVFVVSKWLSLPYYSCISSLKSIRQQSTRVSDSVTDRESSVDEYSATASQVRLNISRL
jgi:hypothetical protein